MNDIMDARNRHVDVAGQFVLADLEGFQELLKQDFPWCDWFESRRHFSGSRSVVIDDLNVVPFPEGAREIEVAIEPIEVAAK
jgi:hypothetical protein